MKHWARHLGIALFAPLLSGVLLGGIALENSTHLKPKDVEPYHARARLAILGRDLGDDRHDGGVPYTIGSWCGKDEVIPAAAQQLLRPNAILSRSYRDTSPGHASSVDRYASLLIVQCRDTRDMGGHYPPVCYPAHGQVLVAQKEREWILPGGTRIPGMQYEFAEPVSGGDSRHKIVYNFIILPGPGNQGQIVKDIKGVRLVSEDYQRRYYGAAQFQLVMPASLSEPDRDQIFRELVGRNEQVIAALKSTSVNP